MHKKYQSEAGSVSMITVIFLALLLSVITISFVRLSVTEQRAAVDEDLSNRAYYAAESGIEDAKRAIAEYYQNPAAITLNEDRCDPPSKAGSPGAYSALLSTDLDVAYTCQRISLSPPDLEYDLEAYEGVTIPLDGVFNALTVQWGTDGATNTRPNNRPQHPAWGSAPAMLRVAIFNDAVTDYQVYYLNPVGGGSSSTGFMTGVRNGAFLGTRCNMANQPYTCRMRFTGVDGGDNLRITPLYVGANIGVYAENSGVNVPIEGVQAIVDVTGRAADVFRRVEARVDLTDQAFDIPDYALWSNVEICKNFSITNDPSFATPDCDW